MIWVLGIVFAYIIACGITSGYALYAFNEGLDLCDLDCDDMVGAVMFGLFWPITLPALLFFNWYKEYKNENE